MNAEPGRMRAADVHAGWERLPLAGIEEIFGLGRTLILAPHSDDESLGCGGLIAASCRLRLAPLVVILTDGTGSHPASRKFPAPALRRLREREAAEALRQLGLDDPEAVVFLGLRDTAAPRCGAEFDAVVDHLAPLAAGCTTICAPWRHDPHCDHEAADRMARAVAFRTGVRHLAYPVWGWTLAPNTRLPNQPVRGWRLDISAVTAEKQHAIAAHRSQHGGVIDDDPNGFQLPASMLAHFRRAYEVFLEP